MQHERSGRGSVADAPTASRVFGREAVATLAQGELHFPDAGLERHAEVLARRHRIPVTHARIVVEAVRP
jgi:hypothetical protein